MFKLVERLTIPLSIPLSIYISNTNSSHQYNRPINNINVSNIIIINIKIDI